MIKLITKQNKTIYCLGILKYAKLLYFKESKVVRSKTFRIVIFSVEREGYGIRNKGEAAVILVMFWLLNIK